MKKRVLYSEANYAALVRDRGYFVDKTAYLAKLEQIRNPVFLRPRRFGKSLFKFKTTIEAFTVQAEDTVQINGYAEGLRREYPDAQIAQFVIYCIGNQGFRVFAL